MTTNTALEARRQVLLATVSLQRFALRGDVASLKTSVSPAAWLPKAVLAVGAVAVPALLAKGLKMSGARGISWLLPLAARLGLAALVAWRAAS